MAARLRKIVDSPAALATFRARNDIPDDEIDLELVEADDFRMEEIEKGMLFSLLPLLNGV